MRSSVVSPRALTTTTTWLPACLALIARRAAAWIRSAVATLVPPNFCTSTGTAVTPKFADSLIPPPQSYERRPSLIIKYESWRGTRLTRLHHHLRAPWDPLISHVRAHRRAAGPVLLHIRALPVSVT